MNGWQDLFAADTQFSLVDALEITQNNYIDDYREYWGINAKSCPEHLAVEEWLRLKETFGLGEKLAVLARSLVRGRGVGSGPLAQADLIAAESQRQVELAHAIDKVASERDNPELREFARWLSSPTQIHDPRTIAGVLGNAIQITMAEKVLPSLAEVSERAAMLAKLSIKVGNERVKAFLVSVSRCYCFDLGPELAVMCRAAMEAALDDVVSDAMVREKARATGPIGLQAKIDAFSANYHVAGDVSRLMNGIKVDGDTNIHDVPGIHAPAHEQVERLLGVLESIYSSASS